MTISKGNQSLFPAVVDVIIIIFIITISIIIIIIILLSLLSSSALSLCDSLYAHDLNPLHFAFPPAPPPPLPNYLLHFFA